VPLGTPLLAGPGAIAAVMVFMREASTAPERVGQPGVELVTRISGLLLTAIAVQLVADAVRDFMREGV
jgi:multiple antibiotic resistance protein